MTHDVMDLRAESPALRKLSWRLSVLAGLGVGAVGLTVLIGWQFHIDTLKRVMPGLVSMNPVTASCFVLAGLALCLPQDNSRARMTTRALAILVLLFGLSRFFDILSLTHMGADRFLYARQLPDAATGSAGGMAMGTAMAFAGTGVAMLLIGVTKRFVRLAGQAIVIGVMLISLMASVGYAYGAVGLYAIGQLPIALHTAVAFLLLTGGLLCRQDFGAMSPFKSPLLGGKTARRLLLLNIGFPFLLGLICVYGFSGRDIGLVTTAAIFVVANICALVAVTAFAARRLDQLASSLSDRTAELEQARIVADTANRTKSNFLANMSHEMRTPMNGILGMLEIMGYTQLDQDQGRIISTIRTSARTLLDLLNDILDFSKIEANQLSIESVESDLTEIIESAGKLFLGAAAAKGITIRCFASPTLRGSFLIDPVRLRQIVGNLISNAVKFTNEGMVTICADVLYDSARSTVLRVVVEDTGVGISPEAQARLFRPFVQADDSTARRFGGTGLGLSICLRLANLMQGYIALDSALGKGSRVTVELPVEPAKAAHGEPSLDLDGIKVVIVDSDAIESRYFAASLAHWQAEVHTVALPSLREALTGCTVIMAPLTCEEKLRWAVKDAAAPDDLRRLVFYSFEDAAQDRQSASKDALYTTALSRARIVTAVAIAAGRMSPEVEAIQSISDRELGIVPIDRDSALQRDQLILLAEDHPLNRDVILRQLRLLGYAADAAENGATALAALEKTRYALVLTDCNMPEMDGFALTRAIREGGMPWATIPVVALTANAMAGESQRCHSAGMDAYLSKPVSLSDLRACLSRWMPTARPSVAASPSRTNIDAIQGDVLDLALLRDCFGDDDAGIAENLAVFLTAMEADLESLVGAIRRKDDYSVKNTAHRIKGAARFVGGSQLAQVSEALEASASKQNWPEIGALWPGLVSAGRDITLEIQRRRA